MKYVQETNNSTQNDRHEPCNSYCVGPIPDIDEISVVADQSQQRKCDKIKPFITFVGSVPKDSRILNFKMVNIAIFVVSCILHREINCPFLITHVRFNFILCI